MQIRLGVVALLGLLLTGSDISATKAASFDCRAATTAVERMICADSHLSAQDERLASAYRNAIQNAAEAKTVLTEQRQWLRQLSRCPDVSCIAAAQETRISALESNSTGAMTGPAVGIQILAGGHNAITIVSVRGIGTRQAAIDGQLTEQDAASFCHGYGGEPVATPKCIADWMKEFGTEKKEFRADCRSGLFSVYATQLAFLGRNAAASPGNFDEPAYLVKLLPTGEILQDYNATGYPLFLSSFQSLCPGFAERAPIIDRPVRFPDCADPELLKQARETAVEAGVPRLMNIKIIDLMNIRTISTSASERQCSATVMLNVAEHYTLFYGSFVKNQHMFIRARLAR
jgi:uncharacterized protein